MPTSIFIPVFRRLISEDGSSRANVLRGRPHGLPNRLRKSFFVTLTHQLIRHVKAIELRRILDKNAMRHSRVGKPLADKIEKPGIVRLVIMLRRVRPIADPNDPVWRNVNK